MKLGREADQTEKNLKRQKYELEAFLSFNYLNGDWTSRKAQIKERILKVIQCYGRIDRAKTEVLFSECNPRCKIVIFLLIVSHNKSIKSPCFSHFLWALPIFFYHITNLKAILYIITLKMYWIGNSKSFSVGIC